MISNPNGVFKTFNNLTVGDSLAFSVYVKPGTATNFCLTVNSTLAWNTVPGGKAVEGLSGSK